MKITRLLTSIAAAAVVAAAPNVAAAQSWTSWNSSTTSTFTGTLLGGTVNFTGTPIAGGQLSNGTGTNYYSPCGAYTQGGLSCPTGPSGTNFGFIQFIDPMSGTVSFSNPVNNLYMALISVGQPGYGVTYTFNRAFSVVSNNNSSCAYWGCGSYTTSGNSFTGYEFSGTLLFSGPVSSLAFSTAPGENWHGATFGADAVVTPEPASMVLLGTGLVSVAGIVRRRRNADA